MYVVVYDLAGCVAVWLFPKARLQEKITRITLITQAGHYVDPDGHNLSLFNTTSVS